MNGKGPDQRTRRTGYFRKFFLPERFKFRKAIVVVMNVDEYNCIWCEGTGCLAPTITARSLVSFFLIFRYSKSAIFLVSSNKSEGVYTMLKNE